MREGLFSADPFSSLHLSGATSRRVIHLSSCFKKGDGAIAAVHTLSRDADLSLVDCGNLFKKGSFMNLSAFVELSKAFHTSAVLVSEASKGKERICRTVASLKAKYSINVVAIVLTNVSGPNQTAGLAGALKQRGHLVPLVEGLSKVLTCTATYTFTLVMKAVH